MVDEIRCKHGLPLILPCIFWDNILCEHRKTTGFGIMGRCFSCPHYERFLRMMDEEDEKEMDEIDRLRREGYG